MGDRSWRPWLHGPYRADPDEPRMSLFVHSDGGIVWMGCGPQGSIEALGDRMLDASIAKPVVIDCAGTRCLCEQDLAYDTRYDVLSEALAIAEGRRPRPYSARA